jgi:EmrB/QacA subfamily drug resistance transporter
MTGNRRWWALGALVLSLLTIGFDATILNVAIPELATALQADTAQLQWIVDAYILVFAGLLLPAGALGDRYGRKLFLLTGLGLFGAASVLATFAGDANTVIAARALMGVGAAILTPITAAIVTHLFPPEERAKAIAFMAIGLGAGVPLGPIVGGYLLEHFWWGSVFLVNVPVVVVAMVAVGALVPESKDPGPRPVDVVGGVLSTIGLVAFVYGVIAAPADGWTSPRVLVSGLGGLAVLALFGWWERRVTAPMIDLRLFGQPRFLWGSVAGTVASFGMFGLLFVLPLYLQAVQGTGALATGVRLLPMMGGLIVGARASEKVGARFGARLPIVTGLGLIAAGLAVGALTAVDSRYGFIAGWLAVVGLGIGLALAPAMDMVLGELPPERVGGGSALTMAMRQVGGALGVALLGSLAAAVYVVGLDRDAGLPAAAADAARDSVAGAVEVAARLGDPALAADARTAYVTAMAAVLLACAAVTAAGAVAVWLGLRRGAAGPVAVAGPVAGEPADRSVAAEPARTLA